MTGPDTAAIDPDIQRRRKIIAYWLFVMCAMVLIMVVLGGVTRLTHSGLSMVEWKPATGWLPPLSDAEWEDTFEKYRQFPEYKEVNAGMTLSEFKGIFWLEFLHRLWGRTIGVAFFLPLVWFIAKGWVERGMAPKLIVVFILGGLQGVLGWYMVKSGLTNQPDVSQYRLTAHLGAALAIYGYMQWVALGLLFPGAQPGYGPASNNLNGFSVALAVFVFITILSGGFVAGLDAGFAYNTFPLMDGEMVPAGLFDMAPIYVNFFENVITVQFDHRILAETLFIGIIVFWWLSRRDTLPPRARTACNWLVVVASMQVGLGISTLLLVVPVALAAAHQAGAVVIFSVVLWAAFEMRLDNTRGKAGT